jgi:predicted metal-dependent hydrolase
MQDFTVTCLILIYMKINTIIIDNYPITYTVAYQKNRKSIQLKLKSTDHVTITAPAKFPNAGIEKILFDKSKWIIKQIGKLTSIATNPINKSISHGAAILYLGQPHTLIFITRDNCKPTVLLEENRILLHLPPLPPNDVSTASQLLLSQWYLDCASKTLSAKTAFWASTIKVNPKRITIKDQKTRWGSCSSRGNINYNWRIIMAPKDVIDYLVVHELCHLRIPNHSESFWHEVEKYSPHFKQHRAWLRTNGMMLMSIL